VWSALGRGGGKVVSTGSSLPEDENEVLARDIWDFEGAFEWDKLKGDVDVQWNLGASFGSESSLDAFYRWIENLP